MRRSALILSLLLAPLVVVLLRDAAGWPHDLAPAGSIRGAAAATIRLPHRWPAADACTQIAALASAGGNTLQGCFTPAAVYAAGGTLADSYESGGSVSRTLSVYGSSPSLGADGWVMSGTGAFDTAWDMNPGDSVLVIAAHPAETSTARVFGSRNSGAEGLIQALPNHLTAGRTWKIDDAGHQETSSAGEQAIGFRGLSPWFSGADAAPALSPTPTASATTLALGALKSSDGDFSSMMPAGSTIRAAVLIAGAPSAITMAEIEALLW